ncbi:MAG: efflux transporter outer membrane subunit [Sumerlaeia bacterium]
MILWHLSLLHSENKSCILCLAAGLLLVFTGGCTVGPKFTSPPANLPAQFLGSEETGESNTKKETTGKPEALHENLEAWWLLYNDPLLTVLIENAFAHNLDLESAIMRVTQSRALVSASKSELYPSANATGGLTRSQRSDEVTGAQQSGGQPGSENPSNLYEAGLNASWEIDLFGGRRRAVEAAVAELKAAEADVFVSRLLVASELADAYFAWLGAQERLRVTQSTVESYKGTLAITNARFVAGIESQFDELRAQAELDSSLALAPPLQEELFLQRNRLAVLLGTTPGQLPQLAANAPINTRAVPTIPAGSLSPELLRRRPDVISAELAVVAANARIGEAIAEYYPKFTLNGTLGVASTDSENLLQSRAGTWSLGPAFQWRLLDFGRVDAEIKRSKASEQLALIAYKQTIINSVREAEDSLAKLQQRTAEHQQLQRALQSQELALQIAQARYQSGLEEFLSVLDAQRALNNVQGNLALAKQRQLQASSGLYKALGGGY